MVHRAALIGCGKIGSEYADDPRFAGVQTHAEAYRVHPQTRLMGVCDVIGDKANQCGARWGVPAFVNLKDLLEEIKPEIVSICTPDETHAAVAQEVLSQSSVRAVIIEKPLATTIAESRQLVEMARQQDVLLMVNYSRRFARSHASWREIINRGQIGLVRHIHGLYSGGLLHNGTHWLDLARYFFGEIHWVQGHYAGENPGPDADLDVWMEFDCGASGFLKGCNADHYAIFEMDIMGTEGRLRIIESGTRGELYQKQPPAHPGESPRLVKVLEEEGGFKDFLLEVVENVVESLEDITRARCPGVDGLKAVELACAIRESAEKSQKIYCSKC